MHRFVSNSTKNRIVIIFFSLMLISALLIQTKIFIKFYDRHISTIQADSINLSLTSLIEPYVKGASFLANDTFLIDWLENDNSSRELKKYIEDKTTLIGCSAIDIVSSQSLIAYQSAGTQETLEPDDDADRWYYELINSEKSFSNEIYYDSTIGVLYIYLNEIIYNNNGDLLGVVGLLVEYNNIVELLSEFINNGVTGYLVDYDSNVFLHPDQREIGNIDIYDYFGYLQKADINTTKTVTLNNKTIYDINGLSGYLIVDTDSKHIYIELLKVFIIIPIYLLIILIFATYMKRKKDR